MTGEATRVLGTFLRDIMKRNRDAANFRVFGPDETASNRLSALFEVTDRAWVAEHLPEDDHLAPDGRVMEILSEHTSYHGYPCLIHRLTCRRTNHHNLHVRGYKEEGTTTTPFDMLVRNDMDRFSLVDAVIDRVPKLGTLAAYARQAVRDKLIEHKQYIHEHGEDMPEIRDWVWPGDTPASS